MNEYIKKIIQNATFDDGIFAEKISYNGQEINAIVELGENECQVGFGRKSNNIVVGGNGFFTVNIDDVPHPQRNDSIIYNGKSYHVAGVELVDSVGGQITVKVTSDERGYMRR